MVHLSCLRRRNTGRGISALQDIRQQRPQVLRVPTPALLHLEAPPLQLFLGGTGFPKRGEHPRVGVLLDSTSLLNVESDMLIEAQYRMVGHGLRGRSDEFQRCLARSRSGGGRSVPRGARRRSFRRRGGAPECRRPGRWRPRPGESRSGGRVVVSCQYVQHAGAQFSRGICPFSRIRETRAKRGTPTFGRQVQIWTGSGDWRHFGPPIPRSNAVTPAHRGTERQRRERRPRRCRLTLCPRQGTRRGGRRSLAADSTSLRAGSKPSRRDKSRRRRVGRASTSGSGSTGVGSSPPPLALRARSGADEPTPTSRGCALMTDSRPPRPL